MEKLIRDETHFKVQHKHKDGSDGKLLDHGYQDYLLAQHYCIRRALRVQASLGIPNTSAQADWVFQDPGVSSGLSGYSVSNEFRCYDTGATQGMDLEGPGAHDAEPITIQTGNDTITSHRWRSVEVAPGKTLKHIVLPATARTVSIGDLNQSFDIGFKWLQPERIGTPGEVCMMKAIDGHEVVQGNFELWPLRVSQLTPERRDSDEITTTSLNHCATPSCK